MRPLDPRLLRYASAARTALTVGGLLALAQTIAAVAFAWLVTQLVVRAIAGAPTAELSPLFATLALAVIGRAALLWLSEAASTRGGATVVGQLRDRLMTAVGEQGPGGVAGRNSADVALIAGRGMEALDGYFAKYLPQLILTVIATPTLVFVIGWQDLTSGIVLVCTLPLVPIFMVLVGWATQAAQKKQWDALSRLSRGFLEVVEGLSTLKLFGRQHRQTGRILTVSDEYRERTMRVLRMSFLSGFVLELAASLSVALIAVTIGLRLLDGSLDLSTGLFVLLLAPEAYLPLRNVGASYHAATEGIEAAAAAFAILDATRETGGEAPSGSPVAGLEFREVSVAYEGRTVIGPFSALVQPGTLAVLSAPSGAGKSSLLAAALGFVPHSGSIAVAGRADAAGRRDGIAWASQLPGLFAGTITENVALGAPVADPDAIARALADAAADELDPELIVGPGGAGLSGGQAQRVAIARALYRLRTRLLPVLLLDEPTSALDAGTEQRLVYTLRRFAADGVAVLIVSHRKALAHAADLVLGPGEAVDVCR
ncbi:ABC transporter ATP-binding protein [Leifsonia xyli subsp. xyli]|uniref:ABC transporter, ATP-binding protein n=2 Tax=Leifsonia xyli subsp. xyli TaxID=59736 RepID=G1UBE8_LEIXX|nr:thiol reductant ABC exporter subunit CydD [Leifsonia xyli]AAP55500.1 cytochrome oxidase subunit IV [Leifsonia xyli subsp. xyli]AAT89079.1 ABC transporter, ATP-binding protein [Leifsonia xyli subsp. xyli str. CTCB07]ODA90751.1 ABC transporter ATP-binding protein [Leifsonia xyli subsp. xyli]